MAAKKRFAKTTMEGKAQGFLERIESIERDMESAKGEYMAECKSRREDIKQIYVEAKDAGVPTQALKGLVKYNRLERKQAAIAEGFDIDEAAAYSHLVEALGELGAAAARAAGYAPNGNGGGDKEDDPRPRHLKQKEKDREADAGRADEASLAQVGRGEAVDTLA